MQDPKVMADFLEIAALINSEDEKKAANRASLHAIRSKIQVVKQPKVWEDKEPDWTPELVTIQDIAEYQSAGIDIVTGEIKSTEKTRACRCCGKPLPDVRYYECKKCNFDLGEDP
jgi:2-methylcitrate dehydratase PrpD